MTCRAVTVLDDAGCPARLVEALIDMMARKERELALRRNALRDPETGLANRMRFIDRLGAAIKRARRSDESDSAVVVMRVVAGSANARPGEEMTDADVRVWREVVRRLRRSLREGDSAARPGQDEFADLLDDVRPGGDSARVDELMARMRADPGARWSRASSPAFTASTTQPTPCVKRRSRCCARRHSRCPGGSSAQR